MPSKANKAKGYWALLPSYKVDASRNYPALRNNFFLKKRFAILLSSWGLSILELLPWLLYAAQRTLGVRIILVKWTKQIYFITDEKMFMSAWRHSNQVSRMDHSKQYNEFKISSLLSSA